VERHLLIYAWDYWDMGLVEVVVVEAIAEAVVDLFK
jgi:hypothetical protein